MSATRFTSRRTVLRGMMGGTAVTVGLPLLDCFLRSNGDALASGKSAFMFVPSDLRRNCTTMMKPRLGTKGNGCAGSMAMGVTTGST